jgi:glycosyltransferase involved in cell wall biosynthesis
VTFFAIPEFISNGQTGVLLKDPKDSKELADKISDLIKNKSAYRQMRKNVRIKAFEFYSWDKVIDAMVLEINKHLI